MSANSLYTKNSRYVHGGKTEVDGKYLEWWDRKIFTTHDSDTFYTLERTYEGRPDKLASVFYNDSTLWWIILQYNNILDLNEEFVAGVELRLPTLDRIQKDFLTGRNGGIKPTRIDQKTLSPIVK